MVLRKKVRTISGVTPVAVMSAPLSCPGRCVYCPTFLNIPKSYTPGSPAAIRARRNDYDPESQVLERLKTLSLLGHPTDKVELIVMGGTFLALPEGYQIKFIKACFDALNGKGSESLEEALKINRTASHRCVGLCIETRPDYCGRKEIELMLGFGATRVELGVQALDDDIYQVIKRGHAVSDVIEATNLLKEYGFKVYYHWMPGLPGSSPQKDLKMTEELFRNPDFRPDGLKIYPTLVVRGTELERWYFEGKYRPYEQEELIELLVRIKQIIPPYVRISRMMRDIPPDFIVGGCRDLALRRTVQERMGGLGLECQCIRCREYGHRLLSGWRVGEPGLRRFDYEASGGREIFLSFEDGAGTLFGLLRLRYPFVLGEDWAVVRELHVFGPEVPLGERVGEAVQHRGIGRRLLFEAERIAREELRARNLAVLSGIGAQEYYERAGYHLLGAYMVKAL